MYNGVCFDGLKLWVYVAYSALQNFAQNKCALQYWPSMPLKMNPRKYSPLCERDTEWNQNCPRRLLFLLVTLPHHQPSIQSIDFLLLNFCQSISRHMFYAPKIMLLKFSKKNLLQLKFCCPYLTIQVLQRRRERFDGTVWRVVWWVCLALALQIPLCASRFMTSEVDGDGNVWTRIYGDASMKKGSENWFELETRLNGQRQKLQWWTQFRYKVYRGEMERKQTQCQKEP